MLYIVVALKSEAQAFIEKYKLTKSKTGKYTLWSGEQIRLIISHIGVTNAREATQALINLCDITDEDIYLNVGICGAENSYEIGSLLEIGSVVYKEISYTFNEAKVAIVCVNEPVEAPESTLEVVDMESYGFYDAVIHNPAIKKFHILKVVSDHFEPDKVTKDGTKKLIFNQINAINQLIFSKGDQ